eukprot:COSAG01_NODE_81_length_27820_cov_22.659753_17_plen_154_part_00
MDRSGPGQQAGIADPGRAPRGDRKAKLSARRLDLRLRGGRVQGWFSTRLAKQTDPGSCTTEQRPMRPGGSCRTHRTGARTSGWSIHYCLGRRGRPWVWAGENEGLSAEAGAVGCHVRQAVAGWLQGWVRACPLFALSSVQVKENRFFFRFVFD